MDRRRVAFSPVDPICILFFFLKRVKLLSLIGYNMGITKGEDDPKQ
ncbi:MAG: hypothetical protein WBI71_05350 [Methanothermobacter tenebrarum]|nr:hypothetical protein [Methanobacteriales archaeon]MDI6881767.1 hypothetical protein [Methanothermobacter sp.]HOQ20035.1 hypothetical protein [Methanothermobacter sp.]